MRGQRAEGWERGTECMGSWAHTHTHTHTRTHARTHAHTHTHTHTHAALHEFVGGQLSPSTPTPRACFPRVTPSPLPPRPHCHRNPPHYFPHLLAPRRPFPSPLSGIAGRRGGGGRRGGEKFPCAAEFEGFCDARDEETTDGIYVYMYMYVYIYVYMYIYMYVIYIYIYTHTHVYIILYICICIYMYI